MRSAALALALLAGCAGTGPAPTGASLPAVEGTAMYRERMALPAAATFEAVLQDVSRADAPAMEVSSTTLAHAPDPFIRFTIPYEPDRIDPGHRYAVRAVIRVGQELWFTSDTAYPVLTQGAGRSVEVLLKRVAQPAAAAASLMKTEWRIVSLAGGPLQALQDRQAPQLTLESEPDGARWSATIGCNRMSGAVTVTGGGVSFKPGSATLMACAPPLDALEKQLAQSLAASTQWRIEGDRLELRDDAGVQTLMCEAFSPPKSGDDSGPDRR